MSKPIENCPQPETPIRERAWTAAKVLAQAALERRDRGDVVTEAMLRAYAATLRQQAERTCSDERPCINCYTDQGECLGPAPETLRQQAERGDGAVSAWREEWAGSDPGRGWYIRESTGINGRVVAYLGENIASELVREVIAAHNASLFIGKPEECADACPPQQVCDYCQAVAPLLRAPAEQGGRVDAAMTLEDRVEFALRDAGFDLDEASHIAALAQNAQPKPKPWPAPFEVVQKWALENGYSGASDDVACEAYERAHPTQNAQGEAVADAIYGSGGLRDKLIELFYRQRDSEDDATLADQVLALLPDHHAERARVPADWVLVPREPTFGMIAAGSASLKVDVDFTRRPQMPTRERAARNAYVSMLSAAPSQPEDTSHDE